MKKVSGIFLFCWLLMGWVFPTQIDLEVDDFNIKPKNGKPEFYTMQWTDGTVLDHKETPLTIYVEGMGQQNIQLLVDKKQTGVLYAADICTPVCADGDCRLMYIRFYWNLLGKYAGFDRVLDEPLTKHDHDEFLEEDYQRLHLLLQDAHSVLRGREVKDLVKTPESNGVDAVAGATIAEVKESVVEGALYSCYTAWQLVHGDTKERMKQHTMSTYDDNLKRHMLHSDEYDYQLFALERLDQNQFLDNQKRILEILQSSIPLVRRFIINNLPKIFWEDEHLQLQLWECFKSIDVNSKSLLLNHVDTASEKALEIVSENLKTMTKNQLKIYLENLNKKQYLGQNTLDNLQAFAASNHAIYGYLVKAFLENYQK
ncbi:hypothetical protein [Flagellimonas sp. 2504JD4-2]